VLVYQRVPYWENQHKAQLKVNGQHPFLDAELQRGQSCQTVAVGHCRSTKRFAVETSPLKDDLPINNGDFP